MRIMQKYAIKNLRILHFRLKKILRILHISGEKILRKGNNLLVKSSSYKTHASLDAFCKKYSSRITNERYLIYAKDYAREETMRYLPAYLSYFL